MRTYSIPVAPQVGPHVQAADVKDYRSKDDEEHAYLVRKNVGGRVTAISTEQSRALPESRPRSSVRQLAPPARALSPRQGRFLFGFGDDPRFPTKNESRPLKEKVSAPNDDGAERPPT